MEDGKRGGRQVVGHPGPGRAAGGPCHPHAIKAKGFRLPQVWEEFQKAQQSAQIVTTPFRYKDAVDEWGKTKEKAGKSTKYVTSGKSTLLKFAEGRTEE